MTLRRLCRGLRSGVAPGGVTLFAGTWRVNVFEEQRLQEGWLTKGVLEFFLIVLRHVAEKLGLPLAVGSHTLGERLHSSENAAALRMAVQSWKAWEKTAAAFGAARGVVVPVLLDSAKCAQKVVLVSARASGDGVSFAAASSVHARARHAMAAWIAHA